MAEITEDIRRFADRLALCIESRDYAGAHSMLAPWLQVDVTREALQSEIEAELREVADGFDIEELVHPDGHQLDTGVLSYEDLVRESLTGTAIPTGLTKENFVLWMCVTMLSNDDDLDVDAWFDLWIAVAGHEDELAVGYYEILGAD
jgi:hypothetical protein